MARPAASNSAKSGDGESGSTVVWAGEESVRYYVHGRSLAHNSRLLEAQARFMTNQLSGLGFVHTGHVRSFVYDVADLYKAELTIPLAFDLAKEAPLDIGSAARKALRDVFHGGEFLERCVRDIRHLLLPDQTEPSVDADLAQNVVYLWDGSQRTVSGGTAYGADSPW